MPSIHSLACTVSGRRPARVVLRPGRPDAGHRFYAFPRLVTHIDDQAIHAVGDLYAELGLTGPRRSRVRYWT
jgi:hypothetical protein